MAKQPTFRVLVARTARRDLAEAIVWSRRQFGENPAHRCSDLLTQALDDIGEDPERPGARRRPELGAGVSVYAAEFSRERARSPLGVVRKPRHLLVYRRTGDEIEVLRVLHDSRDIERHLRTINS